MVPLKHSQLGGGNSVYIIGFRGSALTTMGGSGWTSLSTSSTTAWTSTTLPFKPSRIFLFGFNSSGSSYAMGISQGSTAAVSDTRLCSGQGQVKLDDKKISIMSTYSTFTLQCFCFVIE